MDLLLLIVLSNLLFSIACSDEENLNAVIMVGKNRVKIRVEKDIEDLKF